jgi:hypothetical protein
LRNCTTCASGAKPTVQFHELLFDRVVRDICTLAAAAGTAFRREVSEHSDRLPDISAKGEDRFMQNKNHTLLAIVALVGLTSEASASFRPVWNDRQDLTADSTASSCSGSGVESPATPSNPDPGQAKLWLGLDMSANGGMGSTGSHTQTFSPGGMPGVTSEVPQLAIPFATRMRLAQERVAGISRPSPVFEPPRAI